jgi:hypothetical protein
MDAALRRLLIVPHTLGPDADGAARRPCHRGCFDLPYSVALNTLAACRFISRATESSSDLFRWQKSIGSWLPVN